MNFRAFKMHSSKRKLKKQGLKAFKLLGKGLHINLEIESVVLM